MKLRIYLKSFSKKAINESIKELLALFAKSNKSLVSISLPTRIKKFCVLRSPHVNKDSREEFEVRIYKKFLDIFVTNLNEISLLFTNFSFSSGVSCQFSILEK